MALIRNTLGKKDFSILIGNAMDHFDTALYGFLVPIIADVFFPSDDKIVSLILAYSILASSLITRPIGSYVFGTLAKKRGEVFALSHSLIGVAITTMFIGIIPSYESIGWLAPLLLIIVRIFQGIYSEGECTIAKFYILTNKEHSKALSASYLYETSTIIGIIFASFVSTILLNSGYHQCWRLCFIFGGLTALIGYFLRMMQAAPQQDKNQKNSRRITLPNFLLDSKTVWSNKLNILRVGLVVGFSYLTYVLSFIFMNSFIPLITEISLESMMVFNTGLLVFDMFMILLIGHLVKKISYLKLMNFSLITIILTIIPLWMFLNNASLLYVNFVRIWVMILGIIFLCPLNCWLNYLFKTPDKYMLVGIGSSIGASLIGRLTPSICLTLWHVTNSSLPIGIYITLLALGALWAVKTSRYSLGH